MTTPPSSSSSSSSSSVVAATASDSSPCNLTPNQLPNYLDRNTIANLLQPHLILLSLQDSRLSLSQPIILSTSCYHSINQIIDQLIYSILTSISQHQSQSDHYHHHHPNPTSPTISLPIQANYLKTHGILKVFNQPLAQRSIQAAELAWMVYQNKLNSNQQTQAFPSDYSPTTQQQPQQPHQQQVQSSNHTQLITLSDLFLQLQIDCQILSPYTSHQPWLRANNRTTTQSTQAGHHINPHLNQPSTDLVNQSLDLLLDPYYFDNLLERYDSLYHTVNLPLRQHQQLVNQHLQKQQQQQQQQQQHDLSYHHHHHHHQLPRPQANKVQTTILEDRLVIYFLGVIQAFTNYLLQVIIAIVQTRLPYPSAIQAHHLIGFMAQDDQIINFHSILDTIQAKSSLFPHSPLSPFCLVEPASHHQKSSSLKPLMLTPTMINKFGPASHFLNQIPPPAGSSSANLTPLHSPFLPVSPRSRLQTASLGNRGTVSGARLEQITSDYNPNHPIPFQSFHSFSPPPPPLPPPTSAPRLVSHRSLSSIPTRSSVPNTPQIHLPSDPDLSLNPLPSTTPFPISSPHCISNTTTTTTTTTPLNPHHHSLSHPTHSPPQSSSTGSTHPIEHQATQRSVTIQRAPPKARTRKPILGPRTLTTAPPITLPDQGSHDQVWRPPRGGNTMDVLEDHHSDDIEKRFEIGLPNSRSDSGRLASLPYRSPLSTSSFSINSPRSTTPRNPPAYHHHHHRHLEAQIPANPSTMRHPSDLTLPHHRSQSMTATASPVLGQATESSSSYAATEPVNPRPKSAKSHRKGHSVAQPGGLSTHMSFEQLMRSNETVKFSLTPGPCLESLDSPESRHSSDSLCSPDKSEGILSDPIEMISPKSQASSKLFPRSEILPRNRYQNQSADTPPQLPDLRKFEDQISSPSSNISSSHSIYSQNNSSPPGSSSSKKNLSSNMSSMSQRIAASRTPDVHPSGDLVKKQPQLQSLAEILDSDPPWLAAPRSKKSLARDDQAADLVHMVGALGLSSPQLVRSETLAAKQFQPKASTTSTGSDSLKSQRTTQLTNSVDGNAYHESPVRPQPVDQNLVPSGLQKKLRGFKSLISRRIKTKDEPQPVPSRPPVKHSQPKAAETDSHSNGSFSESCNPPRHSPHDESASDLPSQSSARVDDLGALRPSRVGHSEEGATPKRKPHTTFDITSNAPPARPAAQPGFTEDITLPGSGRDNRSKLRRSISLSSLARRPPSRDLQKVPRYSQTLGRARSKNSKSRTVTENSNSSGTSRGTITDERGLKAIAPGDQDNGKELDEIMALASRLNRRFRGSLDQRRAGSFDSLPEVKPRFASKQRERQETGSSVDDNFEISFAQELKPTMVNRIIFTSPTKKNPTYKSDDNLLQSYYDSSSQSTAIDEEFMGMNFKEFLWEKTDRSQKNCRGGLEEEADDRRNREKAHEPAPGQDDSDENPDEYISLQGLQQMISKLSAIVDQLSKPTLPGQEQDDRLTHPTVGLAIKRADLLKMMIDQP